LIERSAQGTELDLKGRFTQNVHCANDESRMSLERDEKDEKMEGFDRVSECSQGDACRQIYTSTQATTHYIQYRRTVLSDKRELMTSIEMRLFGSQRVD